MKYPAQVCGLPYEERLQIVARILIACESSGVVREAFRKLGHDAYSCDLLPADDGSPYHYQQDVTPLLQETYDLLIAHPTCTYLCSSGLHWNNKTPGRAHQTEEALHFVRLILASPSERIALENPIGCISSRIRKPDQIVQPYMFGDNASKATCLWLKGLPKLQTTTRIAGRVVNGKERWANQTDSGQNRLPPTEDRWKLRSKTYKGFADAMAAQWSPFLES
jgi:hypothetical protein